MVELVELFEHQEKEVMGRLVKKVPWQVDAMISVLQEKEPSNP